MQINPIYQFDDVTQTGIDQVPDGTIIVIKDSDGAGTTIRVQKLANTGMTGTSTVGDFLADKTLFFSFEVKIKDVPVEQENIFTAIDGQAAFPVDYDASKRIQIYKNGLKLLPSEYTFGNGTTINLTASATLGDTLDIISYPFVPAPGNYDLQTAVNLTASSDTGGNEMAISPDGTTLITKARFGGSLTFRNIPAGDISNLPTGTTYSFGLSTLDAFSITSDGTTLFTVDNSANPSTLNKITLGTPWDPTTAGAATSTTLPIGYVRTIRFNNDGTKVYLLSYAGSYDGTIREYNLSTPYDVSTSTFVATMVASANTNGFALNHLGNYLYTGSGAYVVQYTMSTPWDISTAAQDYTATIGGSINYSPVVNFNGDLFYTIDHNTGIIRNYKLGA